MKKRCLLSLALSGVLALSLASPALAAPTEGIAVQLDGKDLTFTDAAPQARDGRTFLPFRAVFEAMGAEVGYDAAANAVSATRGDTTVTMTLGSTQATVKTGGIEGQLTMDVAPFAENDRTYVPVRFAAQALGCAVGWDQDDQTVILLDSEKLAEDFLSGDDFSLYRAYMDHNQETAEGKQAITGSFSLDASGLISLDCALTGLVNGETMEIKGDVNVDMAGYYKVLAAMSGATLADLGLTEADLAESTVIEIRAGKDAFYMRSEALERVMDGLPAGAWVSFDDLEDLTAAAGTAVPGMESVAQTGGSLDDWNSLMKFELEPSLALSMLNLTLDDKDAALADAMADMEQYAAPFRDSAFVKTSTGYTTTLTLDQGQNEPFTTQVELFCDKNGAVTGYETSILNSIATDDQGAPVSQDLVTSYRDGKFSYALATTAEDGTSTTMSMTLETKSTTKTPQIKPPAGAKVVPFSQLTPKAQ